ncbi:MAG TPA: YncE family protein [Candidatus Acidoferrales bacterium]|nr:YncE family protein [Candidatus Acidoferrales bacterium]
MVTARARDLLCLLALVAVSTRGTVLKKIATIDLPGPAGQHFDHLAIDREDGYLLSAHLGPGILYVIDLRASAVVKAIRGLAGITAPVYVPGFKKVYACDWGENRIAVVSLADLRVVKKLPAGAKPNGGAYAAQFGKVYISETLGKEVAVVNVRSDRVVRQLRFGAETGMLQYDPAGGRVWLNLRTANEIAEIDPRSDVVVARYPLGRCDTNQGMALDPQGRRAFLLCVGNNLFTVFDLDRHRPVADLPLPGGADDVGYDPGLRRIYVACESGAIAVIQEDDPNHFRKLEDFPVPQGVHTLAVDPETHRVYAPEQEENGRPVARMLVYEPVR